MPDQETVTYLKTILNNIDDLKDHVDKRFENIDKRFEKIDERFESIDTKFERLNLSITIIGTGSQNRKQTRY